MTAAPVRGAAPSSKPTFPLKLWRLVLGLILLPIVLTLPVMLLLYIYVLSDLQYMTVSEFTVALGFFFEPAIMAALPGSLLAIPTLALLRWRRWDSCWCYVLSGAVVGSIRFFAVTPIHESDTFVVAGLHGAAAALVFWLVLYAGLSRTQV